MSTTLLARLQRLQRETRRLAGFGPDEVGARYPRDYMTPYEIIRAYRRF